MALAFQSKIALLDTSAILSILESRADFTRIEDDFPGVKFATLRSVVLETQRISSNSIKKGRYVKLLENYLNTLMVVEDSGSYADDSFRKLSGDYIYVTCDGELAKSLKLDGKVVYRMKRSGIFDRI